MNKQYEEWIQNSKKPYLTSIVNIAMWQPGKVKDKPPLFKEQRQKRTRVSFWNCQVAPHEIVNKHAYSLREIIIYWLPTAIKPWNLKISIICNE